MPEISSKLASKIRQAVEQDKRSQYALARAAGIDRKQLWLFMRGEQDMTLTVAGKLCEALGLELTKRKGKE